MHDSIFFLLHVLKNKANISKFDHLYTRRWKCFFNLLNLHIAVYIFILPGGFSIPSEQKCYNSASDCGFSPLLFSIGKVWY